VDAPATAIAARLAAARRLFAILHHRLSAPDGDRHATRPGQPWRRRVGRAAAADRHGGRLVAGERPSLGFWACGLAGTGSVLCYALLTAAASDALKSADLLLAASAISAALAYALGGEMARRIGGWEVVCWSLVASAPALALALMLFAWPSNWTARPSAWAGFIYVSVFSMFLGFFAWNKGLAMGGIAKVGQIQLLQPFVALAACALLLGEAVGWLELAFAALVVAIVALGWRTRVVRP
jgi:drug/metabolite transporter (DMT)-like permease